MVFIKHNSLKSDIFFNPIFIPGFSGSGSRIQVRVQGPGSRSRVRIQGLDPGPGSRSRFQKQPIFMNNNLTRSLFLKWPVILMTINCWITDKNQALTFEKFCSDIQKFLPNKKQTNVMKVQGYGFCYNCRPATH